MLQKDESLQIQQAATAWTESRGTGRPAVTQRKAGITTKIGFLQYLHSYGVKTTAGG